MKPLKIFIAFHCLVGLIAIAIASLVSSQGEHFTLARLNSSQIIMMIVVTMWSLSLLSAWWFWRSGQLVESYFFRIDHWIIDERRLIPTLTVIFTLSLIGIVSVSSILWAGKEPGVDPVWAPTTFSLLYFWVVRSLPLSIWGLASFLGIGCVLVWRYSTYVGQRDFWAWRNLAGVWVGLVCVLMTLFHWITLIFQLRFFANNPAWYWEIKYKPFTLNDVWYILTAVLFSFWLYRNLILKRNVRLNLVFIFLFGLFLQLGLEINRGHGLDTLKDKYFTTYHSTYPLVASYNHLPILESIRRYEELYGDRAFTNTKPPGLIAGYMVLERLVNGWGSYSDEIRYARFSWFITYSFPVISMLMVFLLYAFVNHFFTNSSSTTLPVLAALFFVTCSNIILFPLFPDQAIYPVLFLALIWIIVVIIEKQSFWWAGLLGIILYAVIFFAFTMLPLYPFTAFFLGISILKHRQSWNFHQIGRVVFGLIIGSFILYGIFRLAFDYNFFPRFEKAVRINHDFDFYLRVGHRIPTEPESLSTRIQQIVGAVWVNNLDFAAATGFTMYILFLIQGGRILLRGLQRKIQGQQEVLQLALLLSFLLLNLAGTAQGEVARLWMFWVPMVVLFAALEIDNYVKKQPYLVFILVLAQLGTIFLTYHFQDLHM